MQRVCKKKATAWKHLAFAVSPWMAEGFMLVWRAGACSPCRTTDSVTTTPSSCPEPARFTSFCSVSVVLS